MNVFYLILAGLISGIIGGMGMGGGTLLIPILTIFLGIAQKYAQGINLLVFIPMSLVALIIHIKNKLVDFKVGIPIMCVGIIFSIVGSMFANQINNIILKKIFAIFLLVIGIYQGIMTIISAKKLRKKGEISKIKFKFYFRY